MCAARANISQFNAALSVNDCGNLSPIVLGTDSSAVTYTYLELVCYREADTSDLRARELQGGMHVIVACCYVPLHVIIDSAISLVFRSVAQPYRLCLQVTTTVSNGDAIVWFPPY